MGLLMILFILEVFFGESVDVVDFGLYVCYVVFVCFNNLIISEQWMFYFDWADYQFRGYWVVGEGVVEYFEFDGFVLFNNMQLFCMWYWYNLADIIYLGLDIVINIEVF